MTRVSRSSGRPRPWRRWFALCAGLAILLLAPALAHAQASGADTLVLVWTAPGDDGNIGTATAYDLRVSQSPIDASNWSAATQVSGLPSPSPSGTRERTVVRGLTRGTRYYFAIRSVDDAGNWSQVSNVLQWDWVYDTAPPATPTGVMATRQDPDVRVQWSPNSEPDLSGYNIYRASSSSGPFAKLNSGLIATPQYLDTSVPSGVDQVWYQVSAVDNSLNESARSSPYQVVLVAQATAWSVQPAYPNPSHVYEHVRFPLVVPVSASSGAALEIVDAAGRRVRRLELATYGPGPQTVEWDGLNESGRETAPGVYRAWLIAGSTREAIRLVRVP